MGCDRGACGRPDRRLRAVLIFLALFGALLAAPNALATVYTVNSSIDTDNGVCDVFDCTFREAINAANANAGPDDITFEIGIGGSFTLTLFSALPGITEGVNIDATTQNGYVGAPLIQLDRGFAPSGTDGLTVSASGTTIRGLAITHFAKGVVLNAPGSDTVAGNYIGVDLSGGTAAPNTIGVSVASPSNTIGGTGAADGNVISGNTNTGVEIALGNLNDLLGNFIGTDASGSFAVPNAVGVSVTSDSNTIGGPSAGEGNVVSGNSNGLLITGSSNTVRGNYIGTNADGYAAVGNLFGIEILGGATPANGNEIGGGNVISGNNTGIFIRANVPDSAQDNSVWGSFIGTAADGKTALGNSSAGIAIATGNGVGKNAIGSIDLPSEQNTIAYNAKGISIGNGSVQNEIVINSIHDNTFLGIDLGDDGVTGNDPNDVDTGANDLLNFPVLSSPTRDAQGRAVADVTFDGPPGAVEYRFDFYASPSCSNSGKTWIGDLLRTVDANGDITFNTDNGLSYAARDACITATATDPNGNTSEFSSGVSLVPAAGATLTVDTVDGGPSDGSCTDGDCSLGDAITVANATPGTATVTIAFGLPGAPPFTISQSVSLPTIVHDVLIDGTTQGALVQVDGSGAGSGVDGLSVDTGPNTLDGSTIRGLSITGFTSTGISLTGLPSVVEGNYVGLAPDGSTKGNGSGGFSDAGVHVDSDNNRVGGTTVAARNIISGNDGAGVQFGSNGTGNVILGNRIGTNPGGTAAAPNTGAGIRFEDAVAQIIGGTANGAGNLISGNGAEGIFINSGSEFGTARIQGNTIGLDAEGATPLPNAAAGVRISGVDDAHLGGTIAGAGNVISGNSGAGVDVEFADGAVIQGNLIGLDATGATAIANGADQVSISSADRVQVGGTTAGARNVIAGAGGGIGVSLAGSSDAVVQGNYIGTDKTGEFGHSLGIGVNVFGLSNRDTIGGVVPGARNVISDSLIGVQFDSTGTGHRVLGNSIGTNKDENDVIPNDVGIQIMSTSGLQVGSNTPGGGNVIAGSDDVGILMYSSSPSNTFAGNFIGTDRTDTLDLGNGDGMRFLNSGSNDNLIGPSNVFAYNLDQGIELNQGTGNRISANSFHDNGAEAIFLNIGANNNQVAPTLASATKAGSLTTIDGSLTGAADGDYFIEFFASPSCSGQPQGKRYLGFTTVTSGSGNAPISFSSSLPAEGEGITATATKTAIPNANDTSEFSTCTTVTSGGGLLVGSVAVDPPVAPVNLTSRGSIDWAIWGYASGGTSASLAPDTRKSGGSAISNLTNIDPAPSVNLRGLGQFASPPFLFDWTDGNAPTSVTNAQAGLQHNGEPQDLSTLDHGFAFDVPADTNARTLTVYVATNRADGQLTATLSDGSASGFTNTLVHAVDLRSGVYTITYAAASAGQTLHVSWIETLDNCAAFRCDNAAIYAVALSAAFVVNTADDHDDGTCDDTDCSLREAINAANAAGSSSDTTIAFDLPSGQTTISPTSNLPTINAPTTIDATTQPGFAGTPVVTLDGSSNSGGGFTPGFHLLGDNITIRGFVIIDFGDDAIYADNSNGDTIAGNYIGMDVGGINSQNGNGITLVESSDGNTIGGTGAGDRNVISANAGFGINLEDGEGGSPDNNTIAGNYIGLRPDGTGTGGVTGNVSDGMRINGNNNTIGGTTAGSRNYISGNDDAGIRIGGASNIVKGNTIGLDTSGIPVANSTVGIHIEPNNPSAPGNTIGDQSGGGNVISGNFDHGIEVVATGSTTDIAGNLIGTDPTGSSAIGNGGDGIHANDAAFAEIRGNTISGNTGDGVEIFGFDSFSNIVEGNKIGTNLAGTLALGNTDNGVYLDESNRNRVNANTISGNLASGIVMEGPYDPGTTLGNTLTGNLIGTNATGTAAIGNAIGVQVAGAHNNTIGGPAIGNANTISGNIGAGVDITGASATGNTVSSNTIGLNLAKSAAVPNATGVLIENSAGGNTIGGTLPLEPNTISGNTGVGVRIIDPSFPNKVTRNSIDLNGGLGIDVAAAGVTPNDSPDTDHAQNFPTITSVSSATVNGSLSSAPSTTFTIEIFESPACDGSTRGEGAKYVGTTTVATNAAGTGTYTATVTPMQAGHVVTATAISPSGNTSEFSPCVPTVAAPLATNLSLTPTPTSAPAGAPRVKLSDVPPGVLLQSQSNQQTAPVNQTPVNQTPINQLAATQAPVNQTPVNQTPVNQTPVNQSGFAELTLSVSQLGNIPLSTIPLLRPGGWDTELATTTLAGRPLQNVTLRDVYSLSSPPPHLAPNATNPITIGELDLSRSMLGSLPAMAFTLGKLPLSQIQTQTGTYVNWCTANAVIGVNCTGSGSTVLSAGLQGAPVNQTPVNQTPVNQTLIQALATYNTPVNQTPVNQTPVNQTRIGALPVNQTPVNQTPVNQTPVNQLSLQAILAANAPVNQTPVNQTPVNQLSTPNDLFFCSPPTPSGPNTINCSSPTATLGSAFAASALRPGITLGDLRRHIPANNSTLLANWTIADLRAFTIVNPNPPPATRDMTIGDLLASLPQPNNFTLADVLLLVLGSPSGSQGLSFEGINLFDTGLAQLATGGSTVGYRAQFTVAANGGPSGVLSPITVSSTLGIGAAYVAGSSKLLPLGSSCATAAPAIADPVSQTLSDGSLKLTWTINTTVGNSYAVCFTTRPGIVLGPQSAALDAKPGGGATSSALGTALTIGDTLESNGVPGTAPTILSDSFYLSYLTSSTDTDYYRFAVPPSGTRMSFHLSHLPADYDLVVYGPPQTQLRPNITGAVPLDEPPVTDGGVDPTHASDPLPSQTLDDLRLLPDLPMVGVSASRNTDPEDIVAVSPGGSGFYTVQVTGYNGATSPKPYMLRVGTTPPRTTSTVSPTTVTGTVGPALPTLPTGLNTVFLVNRQRLQSFYSDTQATSVMTELANDSAGFTTLGFPNVVLSVDRFASVQTAYAAWNANPGSPAAANGVVQAINDVVDSQIRSQPNGAGLKYLVIVGGDKIIPLARLDDFTVTASNEAGYASTFSTNSDLFATLAGGQVLSDDPYGDVNPVPYLTRQLYIPELAVGRLVETPEEIAGTLNRFVSATVNGHLDPTTSLTTGYDFLFDGATAVNTALSSRVANAATLFDNPAIPANPNDPGDSWTLSQLLGAFLPPTAPAPSITSLNGHASHYQFEPPVDDVTGARSTLFTTSALTAAGTASLTNRLVFSMGCHSGLSVADSIVTAGGASTLDWPQAYAQKGTGAYLGNTGYGYGDSLVVAYSEELNKLFAQRIAAGSTVGNALTGAKQAYYGGLGVFGVYDEKSMAEFTLYGLPMWSVSGPGNVPAPAQPQKASADTETLAANAATAQNAPLAVVPDPTTGLEAETFSVNPTNTPHTTADGTYWSGNDGVQVTHLRPIQPKLIQPLTGAIGHGALITELTSSDDNCVGGCASSCVDPVYARPIVDLTGHEPELPFADVAFPSKLQAVRTFETPTGRKQQLVLVTGQFFTQHCVANPDPQRGVQRLFSHVAGKVFRSHSSDYISPAFQLINATAIGSNAAFAVDVTDLAPTGAGQVKQVVVGVRSGATSPSVWTFANLAKSPSNAAHWTGGVPISGTEFEYFVQAVDQAGNVAVSTNKGYYFDGAPEPPAPTGGISVSLTGTQVNDWFTNGAGLQITTPAGVTVEASVDGGPFGPPPSTIMGDGLHTIDLRASNGGTATLFAAVDTTPPEVVFNTPADGATYLPGSTVKADYFCRDAGSGVIGACTGDVANGANINMSPGTHAFTVQAISDAAGHTTGPKTIHYTVGVRPILFASSRTGDGDIYSVKPDGTGLTNLTPGSNKLDEQPAWSPDGSKIAFASKRNDKDGTALDIFVMDANGQNVKRLTTAKGDDTAPTWSPDGSRIAFQTKRDPGPPPEIWVMDADGSNQLRLTHSSKQDIEPTWSPDSSKLAFMSDRMGGPNIWVMDAVPGSIATQLTFTKAPEGDPAWAPDGSRIAFGSKRDEKPGTGYDIYVMNPDGSNMMRLTTTKGDDLEPAWSRDSQKLVFNSGRDGNPEVYLMNRDGTGQTRLTNKGGFDRQPDW